MVSTTWNANLHNYLDILASTSNAILHWCFEQRKWKALFVEKHICDYGSLQKNKLIDIQRKIDY